jgi:hypothetical protein
MRSESKAIASKANELVQEAEEITSTNLLTQVFLDFSTFHQACDPVMYFLSTMSSVWTNCHM